MGKAADMPISAPKMATAMTATSKTVIPSLSIPPVLSVYASVTYSRPRSEEPSRRGRLRGRSAG